MTTKPKKSSAFSRPVQISPELAIIVGKGPMPRTEVTKKVWEYIKKHGLQSETNRRNIEPDAALAKVLGSDATIDMFKMAAKVSKHVQESTTTAC